MPTPPPGGGRGEGKKGDGAPVLPGKEAVNAEALTASRGFWRCTGGATLEKAAGAVKQRLPLVLRHLSFSCDRGNRLAIRHAVTLREVQEFVPEKFGVTDH